MSEFNSRRELVNKHLMVNEQKSVDGSKEIGATAIYISEDMGYNNKIIYTDNIITEIHITGVGGRLISPETNLYELCTSQPLKFNLPMLTSAQHKLPIRIFLKNENNKIVYLGLWCIHSCEYVPDISVPTANVWKFKLYKAVAV